MKIWRLFAGFWLATSACLPAHAQQTKAQMNTYNNAIIVPNGVGGITASNLHPLLQNMINSACTISDPVNCPISALSGATPANPLIGAASGGGVTQGTRSGTSTVFPVIDGTSTNGQCAVFDSFGGFTSQACNGSGSGTVGSGLAQQYAYYPANGTAIVGMEAPFLHSKNFGAVGNGTTDDTTALQNWVNACESSGQLCWLDPGSYKITTALSVTNTLHISGPNPQQATLAPAITVDGFDIATTFPVFLDGFSIVYPSQANSGTQAIRVTGPAPAINGGSQFTNLIITNDYNGINFVNAEFFLVDSSQITYFNNGIIVQDQSIPDAGDGIITKNLLLTRNTSANACLFWTSGGGLRFQNNKCELGTNGIFVSLLSGASTSQLIITANSFDGLTNAPFIAQRQGTTGALDEVIFNSNACSNTQYCFIVQPDTTGPWLTNVQITGNTYWTIGSSSVAQVFVSLASVTGVSVLNNTLQAGGSAGTTAFQCAASASAVTYGLFTKIGSFAANTNSCGATPVAPS